jgi:hypothetical protein
MILTGRPDHIMVKFHYNTPKDEANDDLILYDQTTRTFFIHTSQLEPAKFTGNVGSIFHLKIENLKTKATWQFVYEHTRKKQYKSKCGGVIRYREYIHTHLGYGQQRYYAHLYATRLMLETAWSDVRKDQAESVLIDILSDSLRNGIDKHIISAMKSRNMNESKS